MVLSNICICACSYLYWSDWGDVPHIGRIGMDGTNRSVVIKDRITWPNGLTLDFVNDRIYWADAREDYIAFANLDGTHRHIGTVSLFLTSSLSVYLFQSTCSASLCFVLISTFYLFLYL